MLLEQVSTDQEFYKSLKRPDEGGGDEDQENIDDGNAKVVHYDDIDSSKTINEAISDIVGCASADKGEELVESDAEDGGVGANLHSYTGTMFSTCDATKNWMKWDSR
jgi:hypothetical protein